MFKLVITILSIYWVYSILSKLKGSVDKAANKYESEPTPQDSSPIIDTEIVEEEFEEEYIEEEEEEDIEPEEEKKTEPKPEPTKDAQISNVTPTTSDDNIIPWSNLKQAIVTKEILDPCKAKQKILNSRF